MSAGNRGNFVDRRRATSSNPPGKLERRQFGGSREHYSPEARELAEAIDQYKLRTQKRYISVEDLLQVIRELGYRREAGGFQQF